MENPLVADAKKLNQRTSWILDHFVKLSNHIYLPFAYLEKVKRANEKYTLKVILWDDLAILLFAFAWGATHSVLQIISIFCLLISFWCVYELGYYENDQVAEQYEEQPKLGKNYHQHKALMQSWYPWLWSAIFGLLGVTLLEKAEGVHFLFNSSVLELQIMAFSPILLIALYWTGFLLSIRLCFWVYNNLNKSTRTWLYILLQSFRYYGFAVVTNLNPVGTSLLSSNILARSILYIVYRYSGGTSQDWPTHVPEKLLRCLIFIFLLGALSFGSQSLALWHNWQPWVIIAWCCIQGKGQFIRVLSQVKPVIVDGSNSVQTATV